MKVKEITQEVYNTFYASSDDAREHSRRNDKLSNLRDELRWMMDDILQRPDEDDPALTMAYMLLDYVDWSALAEMVRERQRDYDWLTSYDIPSSIED